MKGTVLFFLFATKGRSAAQCGLEFMAIVSYLPGQVLVLTFWFRLPYVHKSASPRSIWSDCLRHFRIYYIFIPAMPGIKMHCTCVASTLPWTFHLNHVPVIWGWWWIWVTKGITLQNSTPPFFQYRSLLFSVIGCTQLQLALNFCSCVLRLQVWALILFLNHTPNAFSWVFWLYYASCLVMAAKRKYEVWVHLDSHKPT